MVYTHYTPTDHCHGTGRYRGPACEECNLKMKQPKEVVVLAHNMSRFDGHLILQAIAVLQKHERWCNEEIFNKPLHSYEIKVIKDTNEKYKSIEFCHLKFLDSFSFMNSSLRTSLPASCRSRLWRRPSPF